MHQNSDFERWRIGKFLFFGAGVMWALRSEPLQGQDGQQRYPERVAGAIADVGWKVDENAVAAVDAL